MNERAYYNENDEFAAAWLRNVIARGLIAPGDVDTRSIVDVRPPDLLGYSQHHFFAGIGVWPYALRRAGWANARPVWTGSCPCGPFSQAGKGAGFADERHLWPAFFHLIEQCEPSIVFGEQVANPLGLAWLDLVQTDMERTGYAFAAIDLCAAGFGAPHIRQRLYWVANAEGGSGWTGLRDHGSAGLRRSQPPDDGAVGILAYPERSGLEGYAGHGDGGDKPGRIGAHASRPAPEAGIARDLADADHNEQRPRGRARRQRGEGHEAWIEPGGRRATGVLADAADRQLPEPFRFAQGRDGNGSDRANAPTGPVNGIWRDADWLLCRDGKWRPVEPGTFPLANGSAARVGRLRGYGNALVAQVAQEFIEAVMDVIP